MVVIGGTLMKNWKKIADNEIANMDTEEQAAFIELRKAVMRR